MGEQQRRESVACRRHGHGHVAVTAARSSQWPWAMLTIRGRREVAMAMPESSSSSPVEGNGSQWEECFARQTCRRHGHEHTTVTAARSSQWPWATLTIRGRRRALWPCRVVVIVTNAVTQEMGVGKQLESQGRKKLF
ncbi:hypothetical protein F5148DRAFT_1371986, partial [Russula earlei]